MSPPVTVVTLAAGDDSDVEWHDAQEHSARPAGLERSLSVSTQGSRPGSPHSFVSTASSSHIGPHTVPAPYDYHRGSSDDHHAVHPHYADSDEEPRSPVDSQYSRHSSRWKGFFSGNRRSKDSAQMDEPPEIVLSPSRTVPPEEFRQKAERAVNRLSQIQDRAQGAQAASKLVVNQQKAAPRPAPPPQPLRNVNAEEKAPAGHERNESVYSTYSFYDLPPDQSTDTLTRRSPSPAAAPPPEAPRPKPAAQPMAQLNLPPGPITTFAKSTRAARAQATDATATPSGTSQDPNDLVLLGIQEHEAGNLPRAITYFQRAAQGGSGHGVRSRVAGTSND
jgi:hypothetical protein